MDSELPTTIETTLPLLLLVATPRRLPTDSSPLATTMLKSSLSDEGGIMQKSPMFEHWVPLATYIFLRC